MTNGKPMFALRLTDANERPRVSIRVWPPKRRKQAWTSAIQIVGIGDGAVFDAYAPSPFECQLFAMRMIREKLSASGGQYFLAGEPIDAVLPMYAPSQFGPKVQKEVETLIAEITDREINRMHRKLGKKYPDYPFKVD